ncbi:MAG: PEP-CTERM sorting domain-containing protein [Planctomycetales bacterium]|nr:PEP-CTERM sorting domain-containing protein [Planctomycetales bacterium]
MIRNWFACFSLIAAACVAAAPAHAQSLTDGGFEDSGLFTMDGAPFVGTWEAFTSGDPLSQISTTMPYAGSQHLELAIAGAANQFAGVFQDVPGIVSGQLFDWSGYHALVNGPSSGIEIRIEWRDSVADTEIARTANFAPTPGSSYEPFSLVAEAPAGADTARVVYAIQSFGGAETQTVYVDGAAFSRVVPEPASACLALLGLGFLRRRR